MSAPATIDLVSVVLTVLGSISQPPERLEDLERLLRAKPQQLTLTDLGLDSLGLLEFCISLEIDHGVVVSPERLVGAHSADQLLRLLRRATD